MTDREPLPKDIIWLGVALMAVQLWLASRLQLAFDEAYYWTWTKHPALSYFDHPPMVAWFIRVGTALLGDTELGVRLLGPISLFATTILLMQAVRDFGGDRRAMVIAGLFTQATIASQAVGLIMTPDTPLLVFTALTVRLLARLCAGGSPAWWLAVGLASGLALLSKYTALVLGLGMLIWLVASPKRRADLATPWPWLGGVLALAVFSPVIIWNATHDWASFARQGGRTLEAAHWSLKTFLTFVGAQFGLATPLIGVAFGIGVVGVALEGLRYHTDKGILLPALVIPLAAYLTYYSLSHDTEANWTLVVLPAAIVASALWLSDDWDVRRTRIFTWLACGMGALLSVALLAYVAIPFDSPLGRRDMTSRLSGHREVAAAVASAARAEGTTTIATVNYGTAALLTFYLPPGFDVVQVNEGFRYRDRPMSASTKSHLEEGPVLAVSTVGAQAVIARFFTSISPVGQIDRLHRGTPVERFALQRASGFHQ